MRNVRPLLLGLLLLVSCQPGKDSSPSAHLTYQSHRYEGRFLNEWIALALDMLREQQVSPPEAARILGYVGLTAWEAVCNGLPNGRSLSGQIHNYAAPKFDPSKVYDWGLVLCAAMRKVLPELFEQVSDSQLFALHALAAQQEDALLQRGLTERIRQDSRFWGERIAATVAARARNDGRASIRNLTAALPQRDAQHPHYWTPPAPSQSAVEPLWSQVNTFFWTPDDRCVPPSPPLFSTELGSEWYAQAQEVASVPKTTANRVVAFHWEDGPGHSSTAAGHWFNIARQLLEREGSHLADCARLYCQLGLAAADACWVAWSVKYQYFLLRPVTYIQENIDANWKPLVFTPAHPEYISEGAVLAAACSALLLQHVGNSGFIDSTHQGALLYTPEGGPFVLPERLFPSLSGAAQEAVFASVIGGTHFRRSCEAGEQSGKCLAEQLLRRIAFFQ